MRFSCTAEVQKHRAAHGAKASWISEEKNTQADPFPAVQLGIIIHARLIIVDLPDMDETG